MTKTKVCKRCKQSKALTAFSVVTQTRQLVSGPKQYSYPFATCKQCSAARFKAQVIASPVAYFRNKLHQMKRHAAAKGLPCALTVEALCSMWLTQGCKCYWSGRTMTIGTGAASASPDRLDNRKGYVPGNVVLCCWQVNRFRSNIPVNDFEQLVLDCAKATISRQAKDL